MSMIGAHRDRPPIACPLPTQLFGQDRFDHRHHVHIALQVRPFVEAFRVLLAAGGAQVGKVNAIAEGLNHPHQIVIGAHAV